MFTSEQALKKHKFENHYSVENTYDCKQCGKDFLSKLKLNLHTRNSHKQKNCELCDVVVSVGNYSRHKKEKHFVFDENLNPLFKCEKCGKAFTRKETLQNHIKSCGAIFNNEEFNSSLKQFEKLWIIAMEKFSITMPLKVHIICHHLSDFFTFTGKTLRKVNDQVVEASHHKVKMFFEARPNYNHQNKETLSSGEATLAGIIHFNSINI